MTAELLQGAEFRKADRFFDKELAIDLGGVRVPLLAMGANHTRSDTAFSELVTMAIHFGVGLP